MTTIPGTYFTKEQLEAALKVDNISAGDRTGSDRSNHLGYIYKNEKKQYEKALAWYLLAAIENNSIAQNNIGALYYNGHGVPKNYLCALKWFLKATEGFSWLAICNLIGNLFENGYGVPLNKYKALEWYCHRGDYTNINRLKKQGYHRSATDKEKPVQQLRKETEVILDAEKKHLEEKQDKTQKEMEALVDVKITYKLLGGRQDAWKDVPILLATSQQRYTESIHSSSTSRDQVILELRKQIQLLRQERSTFEIQAEQLQSFQQEESIFQLQLKEKDRQITLLRSDFQLLQHKNVTFQQQINTKDNKTTSLQREIQELQLKTNNLEQQVREKDSKISVLENEQHRHHRTSIQQTQTLNSLRQDKANTANEMEQLKSSYAILEQLLKSNQDTIASLNRENQGNQQGANEMVDTLKSLLQAKTSETELLKQNMEHALDQEKEKNKNLLKEIKQLKQRQTVNSREARPSSSTIVPEATVPEATALNTRTNEDDPNNDINYDSECGTDNSGSDDTSSEDGDHANDLNYDSDV